MAKIFYIIQMCKIKIINKKFVGLIFFLWASMFIFLVPLKRFSSRMGCGIAPWGLPFLLSNVFFVLIFWASVVYFFSDVPFSTRESMYQYIRLGKDKWGRMQLFQIILNSFIIVLCLFLLSIVTLGKDIKITSEWGEIYYTVSLTDIYEQYDLLFNVPYKIISQYSVQKAIGLTLLILFLSVTFVGMTMFLIGLQFSNSASIFVGEIFAVTPLISSNISKKWDDKIFYFTPPSWVGIENIGYNYNINKPSINYVIIVLILGIIIMWILSLKKIKKSGIYK